MLEIADDLEQFHRRLRVETGGRLVENGDLRLLHQDLGKPQPLAHAAGEGGDALLGHLRQPDMLERRRDALLALLGGQADQSRHVAHIVGRGEVVVEADLIGQIADPALDRERLAHRIESDHARLSLGDVAQSEQHQDGRGLAGAIGTEQPEESRRPPPKRRCP